MALFSFELPANWPTDPRAILDRAWISGGYDNAPVAVRRRYDTQTLALLREENESGTLSVPWPIRGETRVVTSSTLRVRPESYSLLLELARGAVNRTRNLHFAMQSAEIPYPPALRADLVEISRAFGRAVMSEDRAICDGHAAIVLEAASLLADRLADALTRYRLLARANNRRPLPTLLGCRLSAPLAPEEADDYGRVFNAVRIVPNWKRIEPHESQFNWSELDPLVHWADAVGLSISIGPLVDLDPGSIPDWLLSSSGDFPNLSAFLSDFVGTLAARYRDRCKNWLLFSGFNHADRLGLDEDDRLRLAARLLETARDIDAQAHWSIGLQQPWGDFLANSELRYSPLAFADTLLRSGFEVAALELDLTFGSLPRDPLDTLQLLELFEPLNCPLDVSLAGPVSETEMMPLATVEAMVASPAVRAVYWDAWSVNQPNSRIPTAALSPFSPERPALAWFGELRKNWLR